MAPRQISGVEVVHVPVLIFVSSVLRGNFISSESRGRGDAMSDRSKRRTHASRILFCRSEEDRTRSLLVYATRVVLSIVMVMSGALSHFLCEARVAL